MPSNQRAELSPARSHNGSQKPSQLAGTSTILHAGKLKALYAAMVKCRMLEEKLAARTRRSPRNSSTESAIGEEALLVGAALDLLPGDFVAPSQRAPMTNFIQGAPLSKILAPTTGDAESMPGCGVNLGIATGLALAFKIQKQSHVTLCLMGKEPLANSAWQEALAFAGKNKLPVVYVVQTRSFTARVPGCEAPEITVDGSDVVAVYRVMQEAIRHARQGYGPTLIQGMLRGKDPLAFMENYLKVRGLWSDAWNGKLKARFRAEMQQAAGKRK
jgi:2-oxoisovalerate dehydrogenase E1 component alpha subunit